MSHKKFADLEVLFCLLEALEKNDFVIREIHFMYLFGMRSDRAFSIGEPNYMQMLGRLLHPINANIFVYFPHSELVITKKPNIELGYADFPKLLKWDDFNIVGGDASSNNHFLYDIPIYFEKIRVGKDVEIKLIGIIDETKPILIVDDLCDGGATFLAEALFLKNHYPTVPRHLFVVHGLFTNGIEYLAECFETITCTNSYADFNSRRIKQIKVVL